MQATSRLLTVRRWLFVSLVRKHPLLLCAAAFAVAGFGKAFMNAGNKQWGVGYMQHDLSDAVAWAVAKGIADPTKVCIMGGSYGELMYLKFYV
jgi:dipeptidyl aminopeptidase/acylaminoacyl peptidase